MKEKSYHWLSVTSLNSTQAQYHLFCSITWPMTSDLQAIYGKKHFWTPNLGHLDMELGCGCCGWGRNATIYKVPVEDIPESYVDFMTIFSMEGLKPRFFGGRNNWGIGFTPPGPGWGSPCSIKMCIKSCDTKQLHQAACWTLGWSINLAATKVFNWFCLVPNVSIKVSGTSTTSTIQCIGTNQPNGRLTYTGAPRWEMPMQVTYYHDPSRWLLIQKFSNHNLEVDLITKCLSKWSKLPYPSLAPASGCGTKTTFCS